MEIYPDFSEKMIADQLMNYGVGVVPTDTQYGLVGKALAVPVVDRIYTLKNRAPDKPLIILISSIDDLETFFIDLNQKEKDFLTSVWPEKLSVIFPCDHEDLEYLHRGTNSLAFRLPKHQALRELIEQIGPLVAPSANKEGEDPATTIEQAQSCFGEDVEFYVDAGELTSPPSTLVQIVGDQIEIVREGAYKLNTTHL